MINRKKIPTKVSWRHTAILALLVMAVSLVHVLWIAKYNIPCVDDYSYGYLTRHAWLETHSLLQVLKMSFQQVKSSYQEWQGTWSAVWLMTLQPAIFSEAMYPIGTVMMLTSLLGGLYCFLQILVVQIAGEPRSKCIILWVVAGSACIQFMPSASQSLYWYNGSVFYTFFFGIFLLSWGLAIRYAHLQEEKSRWRALIVLSALMLVLGGGNYVLCLLSGGLWVLWELWLIRGKNKRWKELLLPAIFFFTGFAVSVASPGNAVRQAQYPDHPGVIKAIGMSFSQTFIQSVEWLTLPVLLVLLLSVPVLWSMTEDKSRPFCCPGLVSALSFCLLSSMNTPHLYSEGVVGPGRYKDVVFYALILFVVYNLYYWLGWFRRRIKHPWQKIEGIRLTFLASVIVLILASVEILPCGEWTTARSAWNSLRRGQAWEYHQIFQQRLEILKDNSVTDAHLPAFYVKPYVLYFDDITKDPDNWRNTCMARYYDKNSVIRED